MTLSDPLGDQLRDVLNDDVWSLPVRPDAFERVRKGRRAHRRRTLALSAAACVALLGGAVALVSFTSHHQASLQFADGQGVPEGSPAPGISPAFVPTGGRDWLLTSAQYASYSHAHTQPSSPPGQSTVESPAPLADQSAELLTAVKSGGLPAGTTFRREDSVGGQPGVAQIHVTLPGGLPIIVEQSQLVEPFAYDSNGGDQGPSSDAPALVDVPGTTAAALVSKSPAYGFEGGAPAAAAVTVVTRGGVSTFWVAPSGVTVDQLKTWAFAAAQQ